MNKLFPELSAPAGTPDAAWAALAYGADAVYAGLPRFSARAEAGNFTAEALDELIGYAHHLGRRIYITFNTLVQQRELNAAIEMLALIRDLNADGVIVQDMGVVRLIQTNFPQLRLHASTQMAVHNLEGARQLAAIGFKRVVPARELNLNGIAHISRNCGIETEVFIHGALCYSYSGLCLFSSHLLGRSGNRGRCAYCCRQPFRSEGQEALPFSMKDFSAAGHLAELAAAGAASFKIEGRMKSPLYVAAVTDFYRQALDGKLAEPEKRLADIQTIFGRPSTELYLDGSGNSPIDPVNDGHRGARIGTVKAIAGPWLIFHSNRALQKHDGLKVEMPGETSAFGFAADEMRLTSDPDGSRRFELPADTEVALKLPPGYPTIGNGAAVYCSYSQAVRQRYGFSAPRPGQFRQRHPLNIVIFQSMETLKWVASADGVQTELVLPGPFEPARQPEKAAAAIRQCVEKLGDTDWKLDELTLEGPAVFVPVSVLNEARRRLIDDFSSLWKSRCRAGNVIPPVSEVMDLGYRQKTDSEVMDLGYKLKQVVWSVKSRVFRALEKVDEFVLEIDPACPDEVEKARVFYGDKLRLALPVIIRDEEVPVYRKLISECRSSVTPDQNRRDARSIFSKWEAANIGGLNLLQGQTDITADWPLYTLNTQAALQWRAQGVQRFVLSPEEDAENLYTLIKQLGDAALVPVYQHTPLMISATRPAAAGTTLTDRSRRRFRIESSGHEFVLTNETPFSLADRLVELKARGARHFRIDLSYGTDSANEAADLVCRIMSGRPVPGHSGNFDRTLE